ncbi:TetR/AcrR family transcriptional regulator [Lentzea flaviverrucosa]|uniref:Transcriptional regulator, TetR family n=1 Tax=Lentzea flaviverrucosa TaxID=200379 RepID=A0A1H9XXF5_9PSEU|nr:TetR/AcrR family transcriptional regulator [Lentzea flaviverrucosa]RDI17107.1 TetR family transcriptional regulator [Lentzea flaviverrucosa]SES50821.1 transcriptional regulator, TetR family [Lentzea flaviverrucosa]
METLTTRREHNKAVTRRSLAGAALRLAMEHGLDGVTVEDIADAAGVSRRTFSNYFTSKEDAVLDADRERLRALVAMVGERPADEGAWQALRASTAELYRVRPLPDVEWMAQLRLLRRHPSLLARQAGDQVGLERDLAAVLVLREPDEEVARLMAATFLTTIRTGIALWLEGAGAQELPDLVDRLLGRVQVQGT